VSGPLTGYRASAGVSVIPLKLRSLSIIRFLLPAALFFAVPAPALATSPSQTGTNPPEVANAFASGAFSLPERSAGLSTSSNQTVWRVPIILVAYKNEPLRYGKSDFDLTLFDTTRSIPSGTVYDYYQWVSRGRVRVLGEVVATLTLPNTREYYGGNSYGLDLTGTPGNSFGALRDALILCHNRVDWSRYDLDRDGYVDMTWLVHAGQGAETTDDRNALWSITSRAASWRLGEPFTTSTRVPGSVDHYVRIDRFSVMPELSGSGNGAIAEIGVYCHEFGHALGLPDLYDTSSLGGGANAGPGNWSLMATGLYGSNGVSPESPAHLGAWPLQFLGWDQTVRPERDTTLTLLPLSSTGSIIELWFQGEQDAEHFLIENRQRDMQFDRTLPFEGLIIYHVNDVLMGARTSGNSVNVGPVPALVVVEADADSDLFVGRNHGDGSDPFPGALNKTSVDDETRPSLRSFSGGVTQIAIRDIVRLDDDIRFRLQVRAPGWLPIQDYTRAGYFPLPSYSPARTSALASDGTGLLVRNEVVNGRPQIFLHWGRDEWSSEEQISHSSGAALDPTLTLLPGGDLAVVWSDTRLGPSKLFLRTRVRGTWSDERVLVDLAGNCTAPAIDSDAHGVIYLAFQYAAVGTSKVMFMNFTWRSPLGHPRALVGPTGDPSPPAITVSAEGVAHVLWIDRPLIQSQPQRIWFSRFHPDTGLSEPYPLTRTPGHSQTALAAVTSLDGTLNVVWQVSGPGTYEMHYQRRSMSRIPSPRDTVIDRQQEPFEAPGLALDRDGGLHLVYEGPGITPVEIHYKRWRPGFGWDFRSANLSDGISGGAAQPVVIPTSHDVVTVAFLGYPQGSPRFMIRRRQPAGTLLDVPSGLVVPRAVSLSAGPNPLRPGQTLILSATGAVTEPWIDIFDLAGRRITSVALKPDGNRWRAELRAAEAAQCPAGVYFARIRATSGPGQRWVMLR